MDTREEAAARRHRDDPAAAENEPSFSVDGEFADARRRHAELYEKSMELYGRGMELYEKNMELYERSMELYERNMAMGNRVLKESHDSVASLRRPEAADADAAAAASTARTHRGQL